MPELRSFRRRWGGATATEQVLDAAGRLLVGQCGRATLASDAYWTSQPGAMRSYALETGELVRLYKLYSSADPVNSNLARLELTSRWGERANRIHGWTCTSRS